MAEIKDPFVELRGQAPRTVVNVLDAVSLTQRVQRWELINKILADWADDRMREATAVMRCVSEEDRP
jgi:hypothetical protein